MPTALNGCVLSMILNACASRTCSPRPLASELCNTPPPKNREFYGNFIKGVKTDNVNGRTSIVRVVSEALTRGSKAGPGCAKANA